MKKLIFIFLLAIGFMSSVQASTSEYFVDDAALTEMFNSATEVAIPSVMDLNMTMPAGAAEVKDSKAAVATVLCWLLGGFGVHRHYLGTKSNMWAIYTFTVCGIFGIVPLVDFFVLLIDGLAQGNIDKYVDNESFFMW